MYQSEYPGFQPSSPGLPWYKIWWKALVPEGEAYEIIAADPGASVGKACLWVFLTNLVCTGVMMLLVGLFYGLVMWSGTEGRQGAPGIVETMIVMVCVTPVVSGVAGVVVLLMISGLSHAIASTLGGDGHLYQAHLRLRSVYGPLDDRQHGDQLYPRCELPGLHSGYLWACA